MKNPIVLIFAGILGAIVVFTGVFVMVLSGDPSKTNVNFIQSTAGDLLFWKY
ncbi:hypothetical protein [Propionispora vibrioides]|uniref:Uncharacterized protein n=1 Tax=Propionispora vibrioides TaxID=112903 RepID=A0A1H8SUL4_9FIRM|nr:hypothetical protein [Propionispora vibrioides]SEO82382.1 hypothetical protein SAMN04490178_105199 [Propionispora vibrioides]